MKKKIHPEKVFISNFDVLKHPDHVMTKKYFLENLFFQTLDHPPVKKKKFQELLTHEIPSETP